MNELSKLFNYLIRILFVCIFLEVCMIYAVTPGKNSISYSEKTTFTFDNSLYVDENIENEFITDAELENILNINDDDIKEVKVDISEKFLAENFINYQYISFDQNSEEETQEINSEETEENNELFIADIDSEPVSTEKIQTKTTIVKEKTSNPVTPVVVKKEETVKNQNPILVHKVVSGDNLTTIAKTYNTTVTNILRMNQKLSMKTILKTGDSIKVSPKEGICHIVKKGESLWKISHEYGVSTKTLMAYNNLKEDSLQVKQNILIPWSKAVAKKITQKKSIRKSNSKFIWPLKGRVTSAYGNRIHPLYKRKIFHTGIDVYSRIGTNIKSTMSGTVSYAGWLRGYGKIVIIKHKSGYSSRYAHLSKFAVKKGQKVSQGKIIGTSGRTGNVTGPHLHFEIRRYGLHKDPVKYLKG